MHELKLLTFVVAVLSDGPRGTMMICSGNLKGCMLGTGGGWMAPSENRTATCPGDIYTTGVCESAVLCAVV
eukprot:COSAG06_NODE_7416_length_2510_cov_17.995401_3_plen_71_part_00